MATAPEYYCRGTAVKLIKDCKARGTKIGMWLVYESSILTRDDARRTSIDVYVLEEDAKNAGIAMMGVVGAIGEEDPIRAKRAFTWDGLTNGQLRHVDAKWEQSVIDPGGDRDTRDQRADEFVGRVFKGVAMPRVTSDGTVVTSKVDVTVAAAEGEFAASCYTLKYTVGGTAMQQTLQKAAAKRMCEPQLPTDVAVDAGNAPLSLRLFGGMDNCIPLSGTQLSAHVMRRVAVEAGVLTVGEHTGAFSLMAMEAALVEAAAKPNGVSSPTPMTGSDFKLVGALVKAYLAKVKAKALDERLNVRDA